MIFLVHHSDDRMLWELMIKCALLVKYYQVQYIGLKRRKFDKKP